MPRPDVSDQRRDQILDAAATVFSQKGLAGTRMEDIANEGGISKGTIYLYFKGKDYVIEALMHRMFAPLTDALDTLEDNQYSPIERILKYTERVFEVFTNLRSWYAVIFEFFALAVRDKNASHLLDTYFRDYQSRLSNTIQEGVDIGQLRDHDVNRTAVTIIALVEGVTQLAILNPQVVHMREQGIFSVKQYLESLKLTS